MRQGFSVALEPVLELALVDQVGLELTEIYLPCLPSAGLKACATTVRLCGHFSMRYVIVKSCVI